MNPYLVIILADVLLATTFVFQKKYQQKVGTALRASLWYTILTALCSVVFLFVLNGFTIRVSGPSLLLAVLMALASTIYGLIGFRIMEKGSLGVYMLFLMSGGMAIPYFYGIWFLGETPSLVSTIAFSLIIASTFISNISKDKVEKKQLLLCIIVFFLNGIVSTVGKIHQMHPVSQWVTPSYFTFLTSSLRIVVSLITLAFCHKIDPKEKQGKVQISLKPVLLLILISSIVDSACYMLQLVGASNLPATVMYPLQNGGTVVLTALAGYLFFREKQTVKQLIGTGIALVGTLLFLL
ncbi:MAG: EamA family transporter [Clostridia bacterium]|nr:EamA family transporter [Clostridia bacterium]